MTHVAYPTLLPIECAKTAIEILRAGSVQERKVEFAHCLWNVQGYVQGRFIGSPEPVAAACSPEEQKECDNCCETLLEELESYSSSEVKFASTPEDPEGKDMMTVLNIIMTVITMMKTLGIFGKK